MISAVLLRFGEALLLTVTAEAAVMWLLGLRAARAQLMLLLVNVITNPLLNLIINALAAAGIHAVRHPYDPVLLAMECAVVPAEALLMKASAGLTTGRAFVLSAAANGASFMMGILFLWQSILQ